MIPTKIKIIKILNKIKKVNLFKKKIVLHEPHLDSLDKKKILDCFQSGNLSSYGTLIGKFEKKISILTKSKNVICTNSGTSALHLALKGLGIERNEEVLLPSFNYIAAGNAILYSNCYPIFIDIEKRNLGVCPDKLENFLKNKTRLKKNYCINKITKRKISAIIVLHTFGHAAEIVEIIRICRKYNLKVIEDSAEAIGSYLNSKHLGTFGDIGILSFNGNKTITTGAGGAVLANSKKLADKVRSLCNISKLPHPWKYNYDGLGYNYKMPNFNASIGISQINKIKVLIKKKRLLFKKYQNEFREFDDIEIFEEGKHRKSNYWLNNIILKRKNKNFKELLIKTGNKHNIQLRPAWILMTDIKHFSRYYKDNLDNSKEMYDRIISIPSSVK